MQGPAAMRECWLSCLYPHLLQHQPHYDQQGSLHRVLTSGNATRSTPMKIEGTTGDDKQTQSPRPLEVQLWPTSDT